MSSEPTDIAPTQDTAPDVSAAHEPLAHRRLTAGACLAMVGFATAISVPSVCLERLGEEFGLDLATRGLLGSFRMATLVASLLCAGYFADFVGKRVFLAGGMLFIAVGMLATAGAGSTVTLFLAQALVGVGCGAVEALLNPLIAELNPRTAARDLNIVNALFSVGLLLAAVLTGELLQAGVAWQVAFLVWPPLSLAAAVLLAGRGYPAAAEPQRPSDGRAEALDERYPFLRSRVFWALMAAMFLAGGTEFGMTGWSANYVEDVLVASARSGGWTIAFYGLFMALGRLLTGALVSRVSTTRLMLISALGCAAATGVLCGVEGLYAAWTMLALGGLFIACFWPTLLAVASEHLKHSSALFALLAASGIAGCTVFSWLIGALGDWAGLRVGMGLLPAAMVVQAAVIWWLGRAVTRERAETPAQERSSGS